jgi:hypothetical protein
MVGGKLKSIAPDHTALIVTLVTWTLIKSNAPNVRALEKLKKSAHDEHTAKGGKNGYNKEED